MPLSVFDNMAKWAGQFLSPALNTAPTGTEYAPAVRDIIRKNATILTTSNLAASTVYYGGPGGWSTNPAVAGWWDTNQTGGIMAVYQHYEAQSSGAWNGVSNGIQIQGTSDTTNSNLTAILAGSGSSNLTALYTLSTILTYRYWRIQAIVGGNPSSSFEAAVVEYNFPTVFQVQNIPPNPLQANISLATCGWEGGGNGTCYTDASWPTGLAYGTTFAGVQSSVVPVVIGAAVIQNPANNGTTSVVALRTPVIFRGGQIGGTGAGAQLMWQPQSGLKPRLMKYCIEAGEDCTLGTKGPVNLSFAFGPGVASANKQALNNTPVYNHRFVIPSTALATSFDGYQSNWVDLGNGIVSTAANQPLYAGINVPAGTSAVDPTWTIATNQWEAITVGFKTQFSAGNFELVQQTNNSAAATTISVAPSTVPGSTIILIVHSTNSATGTPAFSVSANTAADTYTPTAVQTNASDGTNGSSLCILYASNSKGANTNTITVSATNSPTELSIIYLEYAYQGMGTGGLDATAVGTTGSSTAPASGNYTPATAGDLLITAFGTSASLSAIPVMSTAGYFIRGAIFNATQGALAVADNFGNGALATGAINIVAVGTEE